MNTPSRPLALPVRRPPAPGGALATVTRLNPAGDEPEVVPVAVIAGNLALAVSPAGTAPLTPELRAVPDSGSPHAGSPGHEEVRLWAARFAQATVEVLGGDRPLAQLLRWTSAGVYQDLDRRVRILARTAAAPQRRRAIRPQVRSVHVSHPQPDSAEVSVHVRYGDRSRALAARLERRNGRWTCVALQLG